MDRGRTAAARGRTRGSRPGELSHFIPRQVTFFFVAFDFYISFPHVFAGLMKFAMICDIKEKWKAIAGHVGTRDVRACADRFKASGLGWATAVFCMVMSHGRCVVNVRWSNRGRWKRNRKRNRKRRKRRHGRGRLHLSFRLLTLSLYIYIYIPIYNI